MVTFGSIFGLLYYTGTSLVFPPLHHHPFSLQSNDHVKNFNLLLALESNQLNALGSWD